MPQAAEDQHWFREEINFAPWGEEGTVNCESGIKYAKALYLHLYIIFNACNINIYLSSLLYICPRKIAMWLESVRVLHEEKVTTLNVTLKQFL